MSWLVSSYNDDVDGVRLCELRSPVGLFFIPKVMYKYGEPWLNDDDNKGKQLSLLRGDVLCTYLITGEWLDGNS
jgi:hypothetical protein